MRLRKLDLEDGEWRLSFSTHRDESGKDVYDMRLLKRGKLKNIETYYFIEEVPAGLIKPLEAFMNELIKEG